VIRWLQRLALVAGLIAVVGPAHASPSHDDAAGPARTPLTLDAVLASVDASHPGLEAADRKVEAAQGRRLAARGAWDPRLLVRGRWAPVGYYDNGQVDALVRQATPVWGIQAYAGYRIGWGDYPIYKGQLETLSAGEVRAGIEVPIWKDGPIDARRAGVAKTRALASAADCERAASRLELGNAAADAYWTWVAAGQEVEIQRDLLGVARERDGRLREQAELGSIPEIVLVDNERLVLDRQAKLVFASRAFAQATLELSLFVRDDQRNPVRADHERVPAAIAPVAVDLPAEDSDIQHALDRRPELCRLRREREAAEVELKLARNQRAPTVNAQGFVAQDFGTGPATLAPTELGVGLFFEMPLALREARGDYRAARAEARRVDAQLRGLADRVAAEVRQSRVDLLAARERVELARRQVEVAETLAAAEREKFRQGASDLVIVNLRELAAADAARLEVEARAAAQKARADYLTATGRGV
jgi:outer membrane protein TolC